MKSWQTISSKIVHKNPWYHVRHDQIIRPDGQPGNYYVVETGGPSIFIVAINDNKILLVGQERYTNGTFSWEIPGGNSDGQDLLVAAKRELREETGYTANNWTAVGQGFVMNGVCGEKSYFFVASNLTQTGQNEQLEEGISQQKWFGMDEIKQMIKENVITDNQSIVAITKAILLD